MQAFDGVATFTGLTINKMGAGYAFKATVHELTTVTTAAFSVSDNLVVTMQPPGNIIAEAPFGMTVAAEDALGNVDTLFEGMVTIAANMGSGLAGVLGANADNGVATFTGLTIGALGNGYTLQAMANGLNSAMSSRFNVTDALVVTTQPPSTVAAGVPFFVTVTAENVLGIVDTGFDGVVTMADGAGNTLSGATPVTAAGGVASFYGLNEADVINGDSLAISSSGLPTVTTGSFDVIEPTHQFPPVAGLCDAAGRRRCRRGDQSGDRRGCGEHQWRCGDV